MPVNELQQRSLRNFERVVKLMDTSFRIPGTQMRFGIDPLLGLVPGVGDLAGFVVSALLVLSVAGTGVSGYLLARMLFNIFIDAIIGSIPLAGDLFDFAFKANRRNLVLLQQHHNAGKHHGSAWKLVLPLLLVMLLLAGCCIWVAYRFFHWMLYGSF